MMRYRREIDGLRAIAVIPVILFHAGIPYFNGGFIGVDIFFVISGFLITSIITSEIEAKQFSIINFYERRARRIMPMLFFILLASFCYAWFCLLPSDMKSFSSSITSVIFFYSNFHFYSESGYWDISSELKPLLHTWSLAVEEQFYLLFPLLLLVTQKLKKAKMMILICLLTVISICLSQWSAHHAVTANFYLLPTRFWELAIGALIGISGVKYSSVLTSITRHRAFNEIMAFLGLGMIVFSILFLTESTPFPGFIALVPTLGTAMIIIFASAETLIGKFLSLPFFVGIGLISYSAYLWHQPLLAFAKYQSFPALSWMVKIALVMLVFPLSYLSWKFIETPFRSKSLFSRKKILSFWAIGSLLFAIVGISGTTNSGYTKRDIGSAKKVMHYEPDNKKIQKGSLAPLRVFAKRFNHEYKTVGSDFDNALWYDTSSAAPKILVVGNSHGENLFNTLNASDSIKAKFQLARYGYQIKFFKDPGSKFFTAPNYKLSDVVVICSRLGPDDLQILGDFIERLYADGKIVILVKNVFLFKTFGSRTLADFIIQKEISKKSNFDDSKVVSNLVNVINKEYYNEFAKGRISNNDRMELEIFKKLAIRFTNLIVLDRMDYMCDHKSGQCFVINNQLEKYIFDEAHTSNEANYFYAKRIVQMDWLRFNELSRLVYSRTKK